MVVAHQECAGKICEVGEGLRTGMKKAGEEIRTPGQRFTKPLLCH